MFFGPITSKLSKIAGCRKIYKKNGEGFSFPLTEKDIKSKFLALKEWTFVSRTMIIKNLLALM